MLCFTNNAPLNGCWAFPTQKTSNIATIIGGSTNEFYRRHPSFLSRNNHHTLRVSMASDEKSDLDAESNDDTNNYQPKFIQSENILSEFDEDVIWEPIDIGEIDDFFDTIEYPGDEYVDLDDPEELLQEFDKETLLEILGLEDDGETISLSDYDEQLDSEQFADWDRLISDQVNTQTKTGIDKGIEDLERALMRGVVPVATL